MFYIFREKEKKYKESTTVDPDEKCFVSISCTPYIHTWDQLNLACRGGPSQCEIR